MGKSGKNKNNSFNLWQSATDMMTGLVIILLLIIMLLCLYLLYSPERGAEESDKATSSNLVDTENEDNNDNGKDNADGNSHIEETTRNDNNGDDHGNGSGNQTINPAGGGDGDGDRPQDEGIKSAVLVQVVDNDTGRIIPKENVTFELYQQNGGLEVLNTYYPQKISYRKYATTTNGTFYLPEKIYQGDYYLKDLTAPTGYEIAADTPFSIHELYDWPEPYIVSVRVSPARSTIKLLLTDESTGMPVSGSTFKVIAAEDITTSDGTVRYPAGSVVDEISLDEHGSGSSKELYLGKYTVSQDTVPLYYAKVQNNLTVTLEDKTNGTDDSVHEIKEAKTRVVLTLSDELYKDQKISGAVFAVSEDGSTEPVTYSTGSDGTITLENLQKETEYHISETSPVGHYMQDRTEHKISVDADGRINGKTSYEMNLTNRMIRVNVGVVDAVLRHQVSNLAISLYDKEGTLVSNWTSSGQVQNLTDLAPGEYHILINNDEAKEYTFVVQDTADIQNWSIRKYTAESYIVIVAAVAGIGLLIFGFAVLIKNHMAKKQKITVLASQKEDKDE